MKLKLVELLRELFKDEVRTIGIEMGLPRGMLMRHPFPGPGLGVRILGEVKKEYADTLREADAIFMEELENSGYYDKVSQAFAVFLPVKSVGVTGDGRRYEYVIALRAVETVDFMTANWARLPYELLETLSNRIINENERIRASSTISRVSRSGPLSGNETRGLPVRITSCLRSGRPWDNYLGWRLAGSRAYGEIFGYLRWFYALILRRHVHFSGVEAGYCSK